MPSCATLVLPLALTFGDIGAIAGVFGGLIAIAVLTWKLWSAYAKYEKDMGEQARLMTEEHKQGVQAARERDAFARESHGKSEMLATLSREVRAHLNGIVGSADLLLDGSLTPTQRDHLSTLRASAESLHQSLNDILDYSIIESGRLHIENLPFTLRDPLVEVVEHLSPLAVLKGLELVMIIAPEVPRYVFGDPARLRQLLLNLMANSVRFTPSGRVVMRVSLPQGSAVPSSHGGTWVHFSITDTGVGIPDQLQTTIFDRFAQSDTPSPRKYGGSGLDLAISRRLVELMRGKIGVRSQTEKGVEFWVVLPLVPDCHEILTAPAPVQGMHAVVVDDLAAARLAVASLLDLLGVDQDAADTVTEATALLRDARDAGATDLVLLLDESVAEECTDELVRLIATEEALQATRIILLTADPETAATTVPRFPIAGVLRKPVIRTDLLLRALKSDPRTLDGGVPTLRELVATGNQPQAARRSTRRILVVDDDEISRSVTAQLLERLGCSVERATSGPEALDRVRQTRFDLIFMDCQMPEMDGFVTTEKIRLATHNRTPPIVALTASTTVKDREKCFAAGMVDFVDKPARKAELDRILKRWIKADFPPLS